MIRKSVYYSGHVQGVFFRATAQRLSSDFAVTGTVRNMADGRVELVAEGDAAEVDRFLEAVRRAKRGYIERETIDTAEASGAFDGFRVVH